jgi:hypothetical protein
MRKRSNRQRIPASPGKVIQSDQDRRQAIEKLLTETLAQLAALDHSGAGLPRNHAVFASPIGSIAPQSPNDANRQSERQMLERRIRELRRELSGSRR